MNIVLIGYRGAGKSHVGKILATRLNRALVSTDAEIVKRAGCSIPEIVKRQGWESFRDLESEVCRDVAAQDHQVIDTGGGMVLRAGNIHALKATGVLVWLTAEVPTIIRRIGGDTQRPSLTGTKSFTEEVEEVLGERTPKYRAAADHIIATDQLQPEHVADAVQALL